jgi:CheY-like chemotaxis protein
MDIINISDRKKILLADDSATIRKVIELTFADEGIDVYSVADGDAAMKKFVEVEPDLVLADVNMPGMSGYQICEMIKQDESTCAIPVILLTGSFEPFDLAEASRVGCNSYFTKPFTSIRELVSRVKEYLELGAFDNPGPESVDIDDLYHKSLADGANSGAETGSEALGVEIAEPVNPDEEHEIDELAKLHAQLVNFDPDEVRTIPESLAGDNAIEVGSTDVEEIEISALTDLDADQKEDPEIHKTVPQTSIHDTDPLAMAEMGMPETEPEVRSEESVIQLVEPAETAHGSR